MLHTTGHHSDTVLANHQPEGYRY